MRTLGTDLNRNTHYLELIDFQNGRWDFLMEGSLYLKGRIIALLEEMFALEGK